MFSTMKGRCWAEKPIELHYIHHKKGNLNLQGKEILKIILIYLTELAKLDIDYRISMKNSKGEKMPIKLMTLIFFNTAICH